MENKNPYIYKPLDKPAETIRLIKILSTAPIRCQLIVVSLEHSPVFSALSYMWGDTTKTQSIIVDGAYLPVTTNLAHALQDVHGQWPKSSYTRAEEDRWLWADAICINQEEDEEKSYQVPLMEDIYSRARRVFSWLGIENDNICEGVGLINQVADAISQLTCNADIISMIRHGSFIIPPHMTPSELVVKTWIVEWIDQYYNPEALSKRPFKDWFRMLVLFDLPYWKRVWVLQEVVLAQDIILVSGTNSTSWSAVCVVMLWIQLFRTVHSSIENAMNVFGHDWFPLAVSTVSEYVVRISAIRYSRANRRDITQQSPGPTPITLDYTLYHTAASYQATNPKDYVYGMRGLSGVHVPTDYSQDTTVAQTYEKLIEHWLLTSSNGEPYQSGSPNPLWFLDLAGIGFNWEPLSGLASWAPNFVGVVNTARDGSRFRFKGKNSRVATGVFAYNTHTDVPRLENRILHCSAMLVDRVSKVGPKIHGMDVTRSSFDHDAQSDWLLWIFDCIAEIPDNSMELLVRIARALFYERLFGDVEPLAYDFVLLMRILLADLEHFCIKRQDISRETFHKRLGLSPPDGIADESDSHIPQSFGDGHRARAVIEWSEGDMSRLERGTASVVAYMDAQEQANGLLLAFTETDLIGQFPPFVQVGDLVGVLRGFSLPVVLRKLDNGGYIHVGACYIPDLMEAEYEEFFQRSEAQFEEICIH
jgi:hypothetical protein